MTYASRASVLASPAYAVDIWFTVRPGTYVAGCHPRRERSTGPAAERCWRLVMSTAHVTCCARPRTSPIASRIAACSLTTLLDHNVEPVSSIRHTQWCPFPTSIPAHPRATCSPTSSSPGRGLPYLMARRTPRRRIRKQRPERTSQSAARGAPEGQAANPPEPPRAIKAQPHPTLPGHPPTCGIRLIGRGVGEAVPDPGLAVTTAAVASVFGRRRVSRSVLALS